MTENMGTTRLSKHIDVQYHFNREMLERGIIDLIHVSTVDQLADGLTKGLPRDRHNALAKAMGLVLTSH